MATNVHDIIEKLSPARRKKVEFRAAQLIAEEMTLRKLREARKLTQVRLAKTLGITQDSVSRLEQRSDLLLSTLRKTVEAMGGDLTLIAKFPDRTPVVLSGVGFIHGLDVQRHSGTLKRRGKRRLTRPAAGRAGRPGSP